MIGNSLFKQYGYRSSMMISIFEKKGKWRSLRLLFDQRRTHAGAHGPNGGGHHPANLCTVPGVVCSENFLAATRDGLAVIDMGVLLGLDDVSWRRNRILTLQGISPGAILSNFSSWGSHRFNPCKRTAPTITIGSATNTIGSPFVNVPPITRQVTTHWALGLVLKGGPDRINSFVPMRIFNHVTHMCLYGLHP